MKKLTGMKKNFSSLENKKLVDLKSIKGGLAQSVAAVDSTSMEKSNVYDSVGGGDNDYYSDTDGVWKYEGRQSWHP